MPNILQGVTSRMNVKNKTDKILSKKKIMLDSLLYNKWEQNLKKLPIQRKVRV